MVRQLGDREDVDEVEEQLEERRALLAFAASADDRQLRDDRVRTGRHAASIGERSRMARGAAPRAVRVTTRRGASRLTPSHAPSARTIASARSSYRLVDTSTLASVRSGRVALVGEATGPGDKRQRANLDERARWIVSNPDLRVPGSPGTALPFTA